MKKPKHQLHVSVVIPVYNNESTIVNEVEGCIKILSNYCDTYEIIIGDDKSTDSTARLLKKNFSANPLVRIILNSKNKGIAGNILQLYAHAKLDYILLYVGDGDWRLNDIGTLLETLISSSADIVIGKRQKKGGYTIYRRMVSYFHNLLPYVFFGVNTFDAGSIKIYRRELFSHFPILSRSIFHDAEFIIRATRFGASIISCPVHYQKPKKSSGTAANIRMLLPACRDLLQLKMRI